MVLVHRLSLHRILKLGHQTQESWSPEGKEMRNSGVWSQFLETYIHFMLILSSENKPPVQKDKLTPVTRPVSAALGLTFSDCCVVGHTVWASGRGGAPLARQPRAKQLFSGMQHNSLT